MIGSPRTPIYSHIERQALAYCEGKVWVARDGATPHERCPRLLYRDMTRQGKAEPVDAKQRNIGAGQMPLNGASRSDQAR